MVFKMPLHLGHPFWEKSVSFNSVGSVPYFTFCHSSGPQLLHCPAPLSALVLVYGTLSPAVPELEVATAFLFLTFLAGTSPLILKQIDPQFIIF